MAAVACSNPFDLEYGMQRMQRSILSKEVYLRAMAGKFHKAKHLVSDISRLNI